VRVIILIEGTVVSILFERWRSVVATTAVSSLAQTLPSFSTTVPESSPQTRKDAVPLAVVTEAPKESTSVPVDTVDLSVQSIQALTAVGKNEFQKETAKKDNANSDKVADQSSSTVAKIQYLYDLNGEVKVQFMDASGQLVYQVPSKLALMLKENAPKSEQSVNTKA
jgi:hypothetical protein